MLAGEAVSVSSHKAREERRNIDQHFQKQRGACSPGVLFPDQIEGPKFFWKGPRAIEKDRAGNPFIGVWPFHNMHAHRGWYP